MRKILINSFAFLEPNHLLALIVYLAVSLFSPQSWAEYRVFLLAITNSQTGQTRMATSTLDNLQYGGYYQVKNTEIVKIQDTWMCWERGGENVRYCPKPQSTKQNIGAETPSTPPSTSSNPGFAPASPQ